MSSFSEKGRPRSSKGGDLLRETKRLPSNLGQSTVTPALSPDADNDYRCEGTWDRQHIHRLRPLLENFPWPSHSHLPVTLDGTRLQSMDTAGAYLLAKLIDQAATAGITLQLKHFSPAIQSLLHTVQKAIHGEAAPPAPPPPSHLYRIGFTCYEGLVQLQDYFAFIGTLTLSLWNILRRLQTLQWKALAHEIQIAGFGAIPIIALLSFLIGVVLAYQMGLQLRNYGANIYVVDLLGISLLREFAPLLTAIIVAGRTGSAFTAQLGTMVLQEEVDALRTMGINPNQWLLLPKIIALIISVPLLTMLAEIFGILGGMLMANGMLGISYSDFLDRLPEATSFTNYYIGMLKAPFFAAVIASIACFQGLRVNHNADSVGKQTTVSVVQAIFMIILIDAAFSILFSRFGV